MVTDHVIAATGYRVDLRRVTFLSGRILSRLKLEASTPILSSNFESSVPGLYFVGLTAANSFGPMMRFALGAGFTRSPSHQIADATATVLSTDLLPSHIMNASVPSPRQHRLDSRGRFEVTAGAGEAPRRAAERQTAPHVLIFHTLEFTNAARLAVTFGAADFHADVLCRRIHPLYRLRLADRAHAYHPFARRRSLEAAIAAANPDLVIPCDDPAVTLMHRLHLRQKSGSAAPARVRTLIERSLGQSDAYPVVVARHNLSLIAAPADVLMPQMQCMTTLNELREWVGREGYPVVLKTNHSWGGREVAVIRSIREAELAFRRMIGPQNVARTIKQLAWDQDPELLIQLVRGRKPVLSVQNYISGKLANCAVTCWQGHLVASITVEVLAANGPTGNATVVRVIDNAEIVEAARRIVRQIKGSGFFGFDFVIEVASSKPYMVEINPRATQINHLALGARRDLAAAARFTDGRANSRGQGSNGPRRYCTFSARMATKPGSSFLLTGYHDVPDDQPALVEAFLAAPGRMRRLIARLRDRRMTGASLALVNALAGGSR